MSRAYMRVESAGHESEGATMSGCCIDKQYGKGCTPETCMVLPDGKTCGDCVHIHRCKAIFGHTETDTECDWFPRRFVLATKARGK